MKTKRSNRIFWLVMITFVPLHLTAQDYASSRHLWEEGDLTWEDFLGTPDESIARGALGLSYGSKLGEVKKGKTTYNFVKYFTYVDRYDSWAVDSVRTDGYLLYNQTLFDLSELYCRKATKEYSSANFSGDSEDLFRFYYKQLSKRMDELDEKTDSGRILPAVEDYYHNVQQELEEEGEFDPVKAASITPRGSGIGMFVGYSLRAPIRGEFSPTHGITWGWDFPIRKSMIGLSASIEGFGHSNVYLDTKEGPIHQNEKVTSGSAELYYGYNALRTNSLSLYPFAGVGVSFYDGEKYDDGSGHNTSNEVNSFTVEAGLIADVILSSNVRLFAGGRSASEYGSLRFRPYFSYANMRGIGWMPSLSLSVSFNFLLQ
jgi:Opacity protein and related surface antigens